MAYGVSLICRNEQENIEKCIEGIFSQSIRPKKVVIVDDGSTDDTPEIIKCLMKVHPEIHYVRIKVPRIFKGWNIAVAINQTLKEIMEVSSVPWIVRMDSDAILNNPTTFELMINYMEKNPDLGVTGAYYKNKMIRHITDAVRMYRRECIEQVMKTNCIQQGEYPMMYGHDSFVIFRARWLGWKCRPTDVQYYDIRPYKRKLWQWYQTGRFRYHNGFSLLHSIGSFFRYIKKKPYILGSLVCFITWLISHLMPHRIFENEYHDFMKRDLDFITLWGIKKFMRLENRELIY